MRAKRIKDGEVQSETGNWWIGQHLERGLGVDGRSFQSEQEALEKALGDNSTPKDKRGGEGGCPMHP